MGTWTLPALQGRADQSQWVARRQMTLHGHITELQSWGTRKPWTLVSVPPPQTQLSSFPRQNLAS